MARKKPVENTTYWPPSYRRALYFGFGALLIVLGMGLGWRMFSAVTSAGQDEEDFTFLCSFLFLFLGGGVGLILSAIRFRLTLTSRELTLHRALYTRTIQRKEISGYRITNPPQGGTQNVLYLHTTSPRWPAMSVSLEFQDNAPLLEWIEGIPDLAHR
jgi:hypothetical protein